jgi:predicted RNase H-like HicB family nuclease
MAIFFLQLISMQPRYQIHIYHDGEAYVANVPELPRCSGRGQSYVEALQDAEQAISTSLAGIEKAGKIPPAPIVVTNELQKFCKTKRGMTGAGKQKTATVRARLQQKFGMLSNRELAARIGIVAADAPVILSTALSGNGARHARCAIAIALDELPSMLWPFRPEKLMKADDECCLLIKNQFNG